MARIAGVDIPRDKRVVLPTRGQNTKNNARTRKGPTKTVAGKKNNSNCEGG